MLASLLMTLVAGELFLRWFPEYQLEEPALRLHWRQTDGEVQSSGYVIQDAELGFRYRPDIEAGSIGRGDFQFTFQTDAEGFRNDRDRPERVDVVVLGDSLAFGCGVDDDAAWTRLLANDLPDLDIVNLGLIGAAPQQYALLMERFGTPLEPRLVLVMLFPGNDLTGALLFDGWQRRGEGMSYAEWQRVGGQGEGWRRLLEEARNRRHLLAFTAAAVKSLRSSASAQTIDFDSGKSIQLVPDIRRTNAALAA